MVKKATEESNSYAQRFDKVKLGVASTKRAAAKKTLSKATIHVICNASASQNFRSNHHLA